MEFINDSFEEYLSNKDYLSSSGLKQLMKTPKHYAAYLEQGEQEEKDYLTMGSALHCLILEPDEFNKRHFVWLDTMKPEPDKNYQTKVNREARAAAKKIAQMKGQVLLEEEQLNELNRMKQSIQQNEKAMELLQGTQSEMSCYTDFQVNDTMIKLKVRPDALHDKYYVSLKTCRDASPTAFTKAAYNLQYHVSEALYANVLNRPGFIIAIENTSPFLCAVYYTHNQDTGEPLPWIDAGRHVVAMGLMRMEEFMRTGECKGYDMFSERPDGLLEMRLPTFARYEVDNIVI